MMADTCTVCGCHIPRYARNAKDLCMDCLYVNEPGFVDHRKVDECGIVHRREAPCRTLKRTRRQRCLGCGAMDHHNIRTCQRARRRP